MLWNKQNFKHVDRVAREKLGIFEFVLPRFQSESWCKTRYASGLVLKQRQKATRPMACWLNVASQSRRTSCCFLTNQGRAKLKTANGFPRFASVACLISKEGELSIHFIWYRTYKPFNSQSQTLSQKMWLYLLSLWMKPTKWPPNESYWAVLLSGTSCLLLAILQMKFKTFPLVVSLALLWVKGLNLTFQFSFGYEIYLFFPLREHMFLKRNSTYWGVLGFPFSY